ncbi:MAG: hypothetical protein IBX43_02670 [Campylobacterales bacterium]|nr:hypothetical protein [Campylobacterales bacterium]
MIELKKTQTLFSRMQAIDAALYLNQTDFSALVRKSFEDFSQRLAGMESEEFSKVTLGEINLHFSDQQLLSQTDFSFEMPSLNIKLCGRLNAEHSLHAGADEFILKTSFDEIIFESIDEKEAPEENRENKRHIASAVKKFMHSINLEIINTPLHIPVDMNILSSINGKDILRSANYKFHSANPVNVQTKMQIYLPYITPKGVVLLGSSQLKESEAEGVPGNDLEALSAALQEQINLGLSESMEISLDTLQKHSSYYMSKAYLARQMNLSLDTTDLRMINSFFLKIPEQEQRFSKEIYFFGKEQSPSCEKLRVDCREQLLSCDLNCSENYGVHKCVSCEGIKNPFEKVRFMSRHEACKTQQELRLYECHKEENRCAVKNAEIETKCEVENLERVARCNEKKEKLLFANGETVLSKILFSFKVDSSYAVQRIRRINFDPDLKSLKTLRDIHISVDSRLTVKAEKSSIPDIECRLGISGPVLTHSQSDYVAQEKELLLSSQRSKEGKLLLKAMRQPDFLSVHLNSSAYEQLLASEGFVLRCDYQTIRMEPISAQKLLRRKDIPYALSALLGEIELEFEEEELSFGISPVKLGEDIILYPVMEKKAIGFSRQRGFF